MPTFGSLFAGIGGIDLGLERAGWDCRWQVEWDEFCTVDLGTNWPDVPRDGDVTAVDFGRLERVDLIAGGFPCQPISVAGKQRARSDERWLWPEFARAIREVGPVVVLVENVRNLLAIDSGGPLGAVLGDLATLGFDAEWDCLPASAFGAPHERDRVFLVAYAQRVEPERWRGLGVVGGEAGEGVSEGAKRQWLRNAVGGGGAEVADPDGIGGGRRRAGPSEAAGGRTRGPAAGRGETVADADDLDAQGIVGGSDDPDQRQEPGERPAGLRGGGQRPVWPPQSRVVRAPDGIPPWMDGHRWPAPPGPQFEWEPPRTVTERIPNRGRRVKALGNAVVPQIPEHIGRRLLRAMGLPER